MNYIKMSPLTGLTGYGGGATGLTFSSGVVIPDSTNTWYGDRGICSGGEDQNGAAVNWIDYWDCTSNNNAIDFGDLTESKDEVTGASDGTRAVFVGGNAGGTISDNIEKVTISTTSNSSDVASLSAAKRAVSSLCDGQKVVSAGGSKDTGSSYTNEIEWMYLQTDSDSTDFGNLTSSVAWKCSCNSATRGIFQGGQGSSGNVATIDYITIQTDADAGDFGDLNQALRGSAGYSNTTRGVFHGGRSSSTYVTDIRYITIDTLSNTTDFGNTNENIGMGYCSGWSNNTRGGAIGGYTTDSNGNTDWVQYVTIATTGNAAKLCDLTSRSSPGAARNGTSGSTGAAS